MIFKTCSNCGLPVGPDNSEKIEITGLGLWFTHSYCHGTGFIPLAEVKARAEQPARGNPFKGLEIEWYKNRLKELAETGGDE
jgi:hypothetical protein